MNFTGEFLSGSQFLKIFFYTFLLLFVAIVIVFGNTFFKTGTPNQKLKRIKSAEDFHGRVMSFYNDKENHDITFAVLSSHYKYPVIPMWESQIELGDSLSKEKGRFEVKVFKKDGRVLLLQYLKAYNF